MGTVLSRLILPEGEDPPKHLLYYRDEGLAELSEGELFLPPNARVRFDTYFNGFYYPKYLRYSHVNDVCLCLVTTGTLLVRLVCWTKKSGETVLYTEKLQGNHLHTTLPSIDLRSLPAEGGLFLELETIAGDARFHRGWFETSCQTRNAVKVAVVICAFRREAYVYQNLQKLQKELWDAVECPIREDLDVFVVDNAGTICWDATPHIQVIPNRNLGGTGGFTRGLIEAYRRKEKYTHVLFMDDDISFAVETLVKTVQILRFARKLDRPLCIGGQMMIEGMPTIQYESGAFFRRGRLVAVNRGLDLSKRENLLENEAERNVHYNAWWYCCMPLDVVDSVGLPMPFFIKSDDVEYGLRINPHFVLMNGIGVWHVAFASKYTPHLEYYIKRNELVLSAIHGCGAGALHCICKLIRSAGKPVLAGKHKTVDFMVRAYEDFLKGPEFFLQTDAEKLHTQLLMESRQSSRGSIRGFFAVPFRILVVLGRLMFGYSKVRSAYLNRFAELTSLKFWNAYLGFQREKPKG